MFPANRAQLVFDLLLDRVRNLHPVVSENLHAVVFERIVRGGDGDAGSGVRGAAEIGDGGSGNDADEDRSAAALLDSGRERARNFGTGLARVHSEQDGRVSGVGCRVSERLIALISDSRLPTPGSRFF